MKKNDLKEFVKIMYGLADNFGAQLSEPGLHMRFEALNDYLLADVKKAAISIIRTRKFTKMPTVAELLEHIQGGHIEDRARVEACKVIEAIRYFGAYQSIIFDDPVTIAVVEQAFGGWVKLSQELNGHQEKWFIKDFCSTYLSFSRQGIRSFNTLPGITEVSNQALSNEYTPDPILIGKEKAVSIKKQNSDAAILSLFAHADMHLKTDQ